MPAYEVDWVGIVDDDKSVRSALARVFRGNGIRVQTFASAEEFLSHEPSSQPCCLVLDVELGGLNGFELRDEIAARQLTSPPIIFITAHEDIASTQLPCRSGACGYLRKPFCVEALLALVRPHLRWEQLERTGGDR